MKEMNALVKSMNQDLSYNTEAKNKFHRVAKKALKTIAESLGLHPDQYDLRSNKGGIAVSGEITLHADNLYVQISQPCMGPGHEILYRHCSNRKDYCGGSNHFLSINRLTENFSGVIQNFKAILKG